MLLELIIRIIILNKFFYSNIYFLLRIRFLENTKFQIKSQELFSKIIFFSNKFLAETKINKNGKKLITGEFQNGEFQSSKFSRYYW